MKVGRRIGLLMAVALGLCGCRAAGTGSLAIHPRPLPARGSLDLEQFVAEHNRNANRIESLEAKPSITVAMAKRAPFHVDGRMALERPRNFKLDLSYFGTTKADIGSNDEEFWFWVSGEDKSIYWCKYSEVESSALAVAYQPEWIIEALGLQPISPEEADQIHLEEGPEPGTTALVFPAMRKQGKTYTRVMIVSNHDRRIKEYQLLSGEPKVVIAQAVASRYMEFPATAGDSADRETCFLPERIKLDWKRDQLVLDTMLREVKLNQFDPSRSALIFTEPTIEGYQRRNLAELTRGSRPDQPSRVRQTMPPPEPQKRVRLGRPAPLSDDGAVVPTLGEVSVQSGLPPTSATSPLEQLVGAPAPSAPVSPGTRAATWAWTRADASPLER
jgi:hypothetical protein